MTRRRVNRSVPILWGDIDRQAAVLVSWGFTNAFVSERTGLSMGQISYRLKRLGMQRVRYEYRHGQGPVAEELLRIRTRAARVLVDTHVTTLLKNKK